MTKTDIVIPLQMPVSNSTSDTGESRPADSPAKQKTMRNAIKFFSWNEHTRSVFNQWKNLTPSYTTLNCHIFSLPFTVLGVCPKLCISTTLLQGRISLASVADEPFKNILIYLSFLNSLIVPSFCITCYREKLKYTPYEKEWRVNNKHLYTPGRTAMLVLQCSLFLRLGVLYDWSLHN